MTSERLSRRSALGAGAALGLGLSLLSACGSSEPAGPSGPSGSAGSGGASGPLAAEADVPVGGGTIVPDANVVLTQPTKGDFKAFSATCTHQGCTVNKVADGEIVCPCHGSAFSIEDGSVTAGPAPSPLEAVKIDVGSDGIMLA